MEGAGYMNTLEKQLDEALIIYTHTHTHRHLTQHKSPDLPQF